MSRPKEVMPGEATAGAAARSRAAAIISATRGRGLGADRRRQGRGAADRQTPATRGRREMPKRPPVRRAEDAASPEPNGRAPAAEQGPEGPRRATSSPVHGLSAPGEPGPRSPPGTRRRKGKSDPATAERRAVPGGKTGAGE